MGKITSKGFAMLYFSCSLWQFCLSARPENVAHAIITNVVIVWLNNYIIRKYREGGIKFVQKIKVKVTAVFFFALNN